MVQYVTGSWQQDPNNPDKQRRWRQPVDETGNHTGNGWWEYRDKKDSPVSADPHGINHSYPFVIVNEINEAIYSSDLSEHRNLYPDHTYESGWKFTYYNDGHIEIFRNNKLYTQNDLSPYMGKQQIMIHINYWVKDGMKKDPYPWTTKPPDITVVPPTRPDLYELARRLHQDQTTWDKAILPLSEGEKIQLQLIYESEYMTEDIGDLSRELQIILAEEKRQFDFVKAMASRMESNYQDEREWTNKVGEELRKMGWSIKNMEAITGYDPDVIMEAIETAVDKVEWDEDISWRVENRLKPYLQKLDDLGLIRSLAFMLGGVAGTLMEPHILKDLGKTLMYQDKTTGAWTSKPVHTPISEALSWGSRWFTGIPMYELMKKPIYSEGDFEAQPGSTTKMWGDFLDLQAKAQHAGIISGRWSVKLENRLPYREWVFRMYTSLKTYANTRGVY